MSHRNLTEVETQKSKNVPLYSDAGHHEPALHIANGRLRPDKRLGAFVVTHVDDIGPVYGDGFRPGLFFIDRLDLAVNADRISNYLFLRRFLFCSKHA